MNPVINGIEDFVKRLMQIVSMPTVVIEEVAEDLIKDLTVPSSQPSSRLYSRLLLSVILWYLFGSLIWMLYVSLILQPGLSALSPKPAGLEQSTISAPSELSIAHCLPCGHVRDALTMSLALAAISYFQPPRDSLGVVEE